MKILFGYIFPIILLSMTWGAVILGLALFPESKQHINFIGVCLIIVLTLIPFALRDWSTGRLIDQIMNAFDAWPGYLRIGFSLVAGGIAAVTTYPLFFTVIVTAFLPPLRGHEILVAFLPGIMMLTGYLRGAYLFLKVYLRESS